MDLQDLCAEAQKRHTDIKGGYDMAKGFEESIKEFQSSKKQPLYLQAECLKGAYSFCSILHFLLFQISFVATLFIYIIIIYINETDKQNCYVLQFCFNFYIKVYL